MRVLAPFLLIMAALLTAVYLDDIPPTADVVIVNRADSFTLDPQRMSYIHDFRMAYALYEGLVRWDNHDFSVVPAAATALPARSDDGLTYTFQIAPAARWSNGEPVTAHDFVYAFRRALLPDTAADYSNMLFAIEGAHEFFSWRAASLSAFVADPFDDTGAGVETSKVLAFLERLDLLLAADGLPADVDLGPDQTRRVLADASASLRARLDDPTADAGAVLDDAPSIEAAWSRLDAKASRAAEAHWLWTETGRRFADTVEIEAVEDRVLRIRLARPTSFFLDLLCFGICHPVHRPTVEGWPEDTIEQRIARGWFEVEPPSLDRRRWVDVNPATGRFEQRHEWARAGRLVGNGPYVLAEWRYKRDLQLIRNPHYHRPGQVRNESVAIVTIADTNTRVLAFESGGIDWLSEVGAEYQADMLAEREAYMDRHADLIASRIAAGASVDEALAAGPPPGPGERRNIHALATFGTDFYSFNCRPRLPDGRLNPFGDPRIRRAFALSADKRAIVERVTRLNEPVARTLIPRGSIPGYASPDGLPFDADRARREMAAAGYEDRDGDGLIEDARGNPFPVIDLLWTTNTPRWKWMSLELKAQWERALGVRIELRGQDVKFYKEDLKQGKFMIARGRWYGDYGDPTTFLDLCRTGDGNNDRGFSHPRVDELLEQAEREPDAVARMRLLEACERIITDEQVPMVTICHPVQVYMYEPGRLRGFSPHPRLTQYYFQLEASDP